MKDDLCQDAEDESGESKKVSAFKRMDPIVQAYGSLVGFTWKADETPDESVLTDLMCDLWHWADMRGMDFEEAFASAAMHHDAETDDEDADTDVELPEPAPGTLWLGVEKCESCEQPLSVDGRCQNKECTRYIP